jgi:alpha-mannosidase
VTDPRYWIVGSTHTDLAWKWSRGEMSDLLEVSTLRLLDLLERYPSFTYVIEQAAHYRELAARRPDLVDRLKRFIGDGRLEFAGGMASTMETNLPNGECFVRNQFLGLKWVREHLGAEVKTGWLVDTFGINAQVPQILRQFGIGRLMATRFGSIMNRDRFIARGLDGTPLRVIGPDVNSPCVSTEHVAFDFVQRWEQLDRFVVRAKTILWV